MSAARALQAARAARVGVELDGAELRLTAVSEPPADVLAALLRHRTEIVALLRADADLDRWDAEDWQAHFDERAGIAEYDCGITRVQAENMAYEATVGEFINRHFTPSAPGRCAACGDGDIAHDPLLPFGVESCGYVWLHASPCWATWDASRRAEAVASLKAMRIGPYPLLSDDDKSFIDDELGQ